MFDFDTPVTRTGTHAEKYTGRKHLFGRQDVLPFWVADMEFAVAPPIREALAGRVNHPVYGYTSIPPSLLEAICRWNARRYNLIVDPLSITLVPGVMPGVSALLFSFTEPGDGVVVQTPLYPPLALTVRNNNRRLLENPLIILNGEYRMDFTGLERLFKEHRPRMMLLCSPHNPVGRVWSREELVRLVYLARQYEVFLVSDEIHSDIIYPPRAHVSALSLDEEAQNRIVVLNSVSKSFNVAGLHAAYAVIPDRTLRAIFRQELRRMNLHGVNLFGLAATEAAYSKGGKWLECLLLYLKSNRDFMQVTLADELPQLDQFVPEGTYLYWLNFNSLDLSPRQIRLRLINNARVGLNDGVTFCRTTEGFWRFNFAVPRAMLERGLEQIVRAFQ